MGIEWLSGRLHRALRWSLSQSCVGRVAVLMQKLNREMTADRTAVIRGGTKCMAIVGENPELFESRKADHIRLSLDQSMQAKSGLGFEAIRLHHEALPEINFNEVNLSTKVFAGRFEQLLQVPFFISSMTAGHAGSQNLNLTLARAAEARGWPMGVGSQRRQLSDPEADREWTGIRKSCPRVRLFGNIGLAQLIQTAPNEIQRLVETLGAEAMIVHTNPLQECLQPEGTPLFSGGLHALEHLVKSIDVPVILKETGCGFSSKTLNKINGIGLAAVDISGLGGTHWGRIEGGRAHPSSLQAQAARTFADWGVPTMDSLRMAVEAKADYQIWASGGVRSGLDGAKALAAGASLVGIAKPIIEAALQGEEALNRQMEVFEFELKTAMFCTGSKTILELQRGSVWEWA